MIPAIRVGSLLATMLLFACPSCSAADDAVSIASTGDLRKHVGHIVTIEGKVSRIPWQHMIDYTPNYPFIIYFDVDGDQTVIYTKTELACPARVAVTGKVIEVKGTSKDPRSNAQHREHHIRADEWKCLP